MTGPRVCLVSPSHPCCNPRLVKEADALHEAGFSVHAVVTRYMPTLDALDRSVYARAGWSHTVVDISGRAARLRHKLAGILARRRFARTAAPSARLAALAHAPHYRDLARAALRVPADLYLGHVLAALPAVVEAGAGRRARIGFDAEDFHSEELEDTPENQAELRARRVLEKALLPRCNHLTASSPLIAHAYRETCGVEAATVHNVFQLRFAPAFPVAPRNTERPTLYWFSQTIGPGRGLEPLFSVLGRLDTVCDVHLRGLAAPGFPEALAACARNAAFRGRLEFHDLAAPDEMVRLAAGHTLGLSLEQAHPRNRDLCLTNKIFTCLLAGLPVLMTPTSAQGGLAPDLGAAALCLDPEAPGATRQLDAYLAAPAAQAAAAAQARALGAGRWNWDFEKEIFLRTVRAALAAPLS